MTRFLQAHLLQYLGNVLALFTSEFPSLTHESITQIHDLPRLDLENLIDLPEILDPVPDVPLPIPTPHAESLIRKLATRNKPAILRLTLSEDGSEFEGEKLTRVSPGKLAEIMMGTKRPRFYLLRGTYSCALIGFLSRSTREDRPQLAMQSHVKYIALCRAIRMIPAGGLKILRYVRYRHQIDVENLGVIMEELNHEVVNRKQPVSLYSSKASTLDDLIPSFEAEETFIEELVHRDFVPTAHPQLSQAVIEPS